MQSALFDLVIVVLYFIFLCEDYKGELGRVGGGEKGECHFFPLFSLSLV